MTAKSAKTDEVKKRRPPGLGQRRGVEQLDRVEYLRSTVRLCEVALAASEPGTIAFINTLRAQMEARKELDVELQKRPQDPWAGLTEDEIRAKLRAEGADMPEAHLAVLVEVYCERVGVAFPLRAVAGGAR